MEINFSNKVVIVTGGSRGIGRGIVEAFHKKGATVYFTFKSNEQEAHMLAEALGKERIIACKVDGRVHAEVVDFVEVVGKKHKKIDILINNTGIVPRFLLANISPEVWENTLSTNLSSIYHYCNTSLKFLIRSKKGAIVNISSVAADRPSKGMSAYCATKGAIESLSRVLAMEFAPFNIRVNTVAPGLIETGITKDITIEAKERILKRTPLGRFGTVEDVCNAVLFLVSDNASFITGTQLYVTGGKHLD